MIYYFPLESLKSRYTHQLSTKWMPNAFDKVGADWTSVDGNYEQGDVSMVDHINMNGTSIQITTNSALD